MFLPKNPQISKIQYFRFRLHVVSHWARNIVFAPKLVEAVKEVLIEIKNVELKEFVYHLKRRRLLQKASENILLFVSFIVCLSKAPENKTSRKKSF